MNDLNNIYQNLGLNNLDNNLNFVAFKTIFRREVKRILRIWPQTLLPSAISMILYFVIFGNLIGKQIGSMQGFSYMNFIVPGLIMMAVITNSYGNVAHSFFSNKFQKNIEELLIAPLSEHAIVLGYVAGGLFRGLAVASIVAIVALFFTEITIQHFFLTVFVVVLTSSFFSLAGLINAIYSKTFDDVSIVPTFVLTPLTYLGGVFYSIDLLPNFWQIISMFNPVLHMVNAFRFGILGVSDVPITIAIFALLFASGALYLLSIQLLKEGKGMRS